MLEQIGADGIIVFDYKNEEVLWDWSVHGAAGDNQTVSPEMMPYTRWGLDTDRGADTYHYWTHGNALVHGIDGEGKQFFWVSLRNQDWIIKVDIATGQIVWRLGYLGDFTLVNDIDAVTPAELPPRQWMFHQHAPEFLSHGNGKYNFVVFDNGNLRPDETGAVISSTPYSRIVGYTIDETPEKMLASPVFAYGSPDNDSPDYFFSSHVGNALMLPGAQSLVFVKGYQDSGWWSETEPANVFATEISYQGGQRLWSIKFPSPETPHETDGYVYRISYFPDIYNMTWRYEVDR